MAYRVRRRAEFIGDRGIAVRRRCGSMTLRQARQVELPALRGVPTELIAREGARGLEAASDGCAAPAAQPSLADGRLRAPDRRATIERKTRIQSRRSEPCP